MFLNPIKEENKYLPVYAHGYHTWMNSSYSTKVFLLAILLTEFWSPSILNKSGVGGGGDGHVKTEPCPFPQSSRGRDCSLAFIPIITNSMETRRIQFFQEEYLLQTEYWTTEWKMLNSGNPSLLDIKLLFQYALTY